MPTRTRCWFMLKNSNCSRAGRSSTANFDVIPIDAPNEPPSSFYLRMSDKSHNWIYAMRQTLSAARDYVSYSVARGMTLAYLGNSLASVRYLVRQKYILRFYEMKKLVLASDEDGGL